MLKGTCSTLGGGDGDGGDRTAAIAGHPAERVMCIACAFYVLKLHLQRGFEGAKLS